MKEREREEDDQGIQHSNQAFFPARTATAGLRSARMEAVGSKDSQAAGGELQLIVMSDESKELLIELRWLDFTSFKFENSHSMPAEQ